MPKLKSPRPIFIATVLGLLLLLTSTAWAQGTTASASKPGSKDLCPVCGMLVAKYPNWIAVVVWKDGHMHFFDGAKDMFKFLLDLPRYAQGHRKEDIRAIQVTDFYNLERIDARQALYVIGSDVLGPMGHELVPLVSEADARDFIKDHKGRRMLGFNDVTAGILKALDN